MERPSKTPVGIATRFIFQPKRSPNAATCPASSRENCCAISAMASSLIPGCSRLSKHGALARHQMEEESMTDAMASGLAGLIADRQRCLTAPSIVERLSKDFYWYSPVLKRQ